MCYLWKTLMNILEYPFIVIVICKTPVSCTKILSYALQITVSKTGKQKQIP